MKQHHPSQEPVGELIDHATVRIERLLPGPIERVWAWLAESDKRAKWLAAGELEPREGTTLELRFHHSQLSHEATPPRWSGAEGHVNHCHVVRCQPPRLLSLSWPEQHGEDSEVSFELISQEQDVLLVVTHRRLYDPATRNDVASGWHAHLGVLMDQLNGRPPRGFWSAHAAAEKLYEQHFAAGSAG